MMKLKDLTQDSRNANKGTARGQKMIVSSLQEDGFGRSGLIDKNGKIIAGNKTTEASAEVFGVDAEPIIIETDGTKPVYVKRTDLDLDTDIAARRLAYRDNLTSRFSFELDPDVVMADIEAGFDFEALDISLPDLQGLGVEVNDNGAGRDVEPQIDKAEELRRKWGTELGQLWQLGDHRLICGDCTDRAMVERVMERERAQMSFTDPPYGVDYGGHNNPRWSQRHKPIANDALSYDELKLFWTKAFRLAASFVTNDLYVAAPPGPPNMHLAAALNDTDFEHHQWLIWVKNRLVLGRSNYHYRHEHLWYGWKRNHTSSWQGDTKQTSVWEVERPNVSEEHPTMKPLQLPERAIKNSSQLNAIIFDPFLGSGTTLIACENLGRKCRGIEIDPGYVAVTLERWHTLTGEMPELIDTQITQL